MASESTNTLTVCYNGSCPVCSREINQYKRMAAASNADLKWVDVTDDQEYARSHNLDFYTSLRRLHAVDGDGRVLSGVTAFTEIWQRISKLAWIATILGWPIVRPVAEFVYERVLAPILFAWNIRRLNKQNARAQQSAESDSPMA